MKRSETAYAHVIIGNGAAGVTAVNAIRSLDKSSPILVLSDEANRFYSKPGLAYWLTGQIPEKQLYPSDRTSKHAGVDRIYGTVTAISDGERKLVMQDGTSISFQNLLLANGAQAVLPDIEGIDLEGVVTLDALEDARKILKLARRSRQAVIVGGGITALELAEGLASRRVETHYLLRKDRYWGNVLDEHESQMVEERLKLQGIKIHYQAAIEKILEKKKRVAGVELNSGERIDCEMVGVAIGIRPRTGLVKGTGIKIDRGILVDERFQTNVPGIYAAGDIAQVWDPQVQTYLLDSLWSVAREQGRVAGLNMAGQRVDYQRKTPFNVTRIGHITTTLIGCIGQGQSDDDLVAIARGDSEVWRARPNASAVKRDVDDNRVRILIGEQTIQGALVMGDQTLSRPLQRLIADQIDISAIREELLRDPQELTSLIERFWEGLSHAG